MASTQSEVKVPKSKVSKSFVMAWIGWGLIFATGIFVAGFYTGSQNQAKAQADTQAAVHAAVQAVTPAPKN